MSRRNQNKDQSVATAPEEDQAPCGWPGCMDEGVYKAPISPQDLKTHHWFCLEHVRAYNRGWNYYKGMTEAEVEADVRRDTVWDRPSWQWGGMGAAGRYGAFNGETIGDDLGSFCNSGPAPDDHAYNGNGVNGGTSHHLALAILDLSPPVTTAVVKARYKELVKRHHPDANGGDKESEEKFKQISQAYNTIIESLTT